MIKSRKLEEKGIWICLFINAQYLATTVYYFFFYFQIGGAQKSMNFVGSDN